ncbi:Leucine-rich repeat (LRR) protein [Providencia alcalifaciens]|nr:Leucine-rich repeat (LRR) protein [Providencia alcalifaciens]
MPRIFNVTHHHDPISSTRVNQNVQANHQSSNQRQSLAQNVQVVKTASNHNNIKANLGKIPSNTQNNNSQYYRAWEEWLENSPDWTKYARRQAVSRLRDCLNSRNPHLTLSGLYLDSLPTLPPHITKLDVSYNLLNELPELPISLEELMCSKNNLVKLPDLPNGLNTLNCSRNDLKTLPTLPNKLKMLNCSNNSLESIPELPDGLEELNYSRNNLANVNYLSKLPEGLKKLNCSRNGSDYIPKLPNSLQELNCSYNRLVNLLTLPDRMKKLNCSHNVLENLPEAPEELTELNCSYNRLINIQKLPNQIRILNCSYNRLLNISKFPDRLKTLNCSENDLVSLPRLPSELTELRAISNRLMELPELPTTLKLLDCEYNHLHRLPNLPSSVTKIGTSHNQLTELPELPVGIDMLLATHNQITRLPESIAQQANPNGIIDISNNPLSEQTIRSLQTILNEANYHGPLIHFSIVLSRMPENALRPLFESAVDWFSSESKQEIIAKFSAIANEENAGTLSAFIDKLKETCSAKKDPKFKEVVAQWLLRLADSPKLREVSFVIALGATESCEDRVALTWNDMQKAELIHNVKYGQYDEKLPEFVNVGREMFRLEQLEYIAREKVATLHFIDEIEVYLGFQTQLRTPLELTTTTKEMRFFDVSNITEDDLNVAELRVKTAENQQFSEWLAQWSPWQKLLERTEPVLWKQAYDKKIDIYENQYQDRINAELHENGLMGDVDAERALGIKIMHDIDKAIFIPLTWDALANKKLEPLLNKQWNI